MMSFLLFAESTSSLGSESKYMYKDIRVPKQADA